jgi:hypothetical protein
MNLSTSVKVNKCGVTVVLVIILILIYSLKSNGNSNLLKNPNEINLRKLLIGKLHEIKALQNKKKLSNKISRSDSGQSNWRH